MKDFQKTLKELRELSTINEETKALLEKMTGKELVDYESIDALVGALMTHYNGELKKKATTSHSHTWLEVTSKPTTFPPSLHNHDERYYTEEEIDTKFKNYPVPVGGVLLMYNNTNPAEVYAGTTWELLASDKYLKTTTGTPLSTGGSNSFTIQKANLPAVKIQLESFSVTTQPHKHTIGSEVRWNEHLWANSRRYLNAGQNNFDVKDTTDPCGSGGGANTGTASPYTQNLGNGTAISVNPTYITIRVWKRLS